MAQCTTNRIVELVLPFVQANIQSPNWRLREASILSFVCILDGPSRDQLGVLVQQVLFSVTYPHSANDFANDLFYLGLWVDFAPCQGLSGAG